MAGVADRDERMLGELYDRYAAPLLGVIAEIVPDHKAAMEVLQEVFVGVWKDGHRIYQPGSGMLAWLMLDARARAIDRQRREMGHRPAAHAGLRHVLGAGSWLPRPKEIFRVEQRRALLQKIAGRLPSSQNRLLELAVFKGETEAHMAKQLHQPLSRVECELRAGLRFLRHRLRAAFGTWTAGI